jgi:hypothetical protein
MVLSASCAKTDLLPLDGLLKQTRHECELTLQKSIDLTPLLPKAGPTGGPGVAWPAPTMSLTTWSGTAAPARALDIMEATYAFGYQELRERCGLVLIANMGRSQKISLPAAFKVGRLQATV